MKYMTYVGVVYVPKSKIEKDIQDFLKSNNRVLIEGCSIEDFKERIITHISFICQENRRCKPRKVWWVAYNDYKDFVLNGIVSIRFSLYEIKGEAQFNLDKE